MSTDDKFSADESIPGFDNMDIESQEAITRSLTNAKTEKRRLAKKHKQGGGVKQPAPSVVLDALHPILRFPGLVKRIILALFAQQVSCMTPSSMKLATGPRV